MGFVLWVMGYGVSAGVSVRAMVRIRVRVQSPLYILSDLINSVRTCLLTISGGRVSS